MARPQNMDEVKRQIEQVLVAHSAPGTPRQTIEFATQPSTIDSPAAANGEGAQSELAPTSPGLLASTTDPTINAAERITRACDTTATDIEGAAEVLLKVATGIAEESHQLAELLRKHGKLIASHIEEFTAMAHRVALKMREARADVLGSSEHGVFKDSAVALNEIGSPDRKNGSV